MEYKKNEDFDKLYDEMKLYYGENAEGKPKEPPAEKEKAAFAESRVSEYSVSDAENGVREIPEGGHFTDDRGNSLQQERPKKDGAFDEGGHFDEGPLSKKQKELRKKYNIAKKRNRERKKRGSVAISIAKAFTYTAVVCAMSFWLAFGFFDLWPGIIPMANDVFSLKKDDINIIVNIKSGMTTEEVASLLASKGVIEEEKAFKFYVKYKFGGSSDSKKSALGSVFGLGREFISMMFLGGEIDPSKDLEYLPGEYTLNPSLNYDQILTKLTTESYTREEVEITIPEGFTADQIIDLLLENGIGSRDGYVYAINEYPYKHEFVQLLMEQGWPEGRIYRLEGYLYPDKYRFFLDSDEVDVINKMLNNFSTRIWSEHYRTYKAGCEAMGMTFDQMITFASIVQAEGRTFTDFENVSQVFHNRFDAPALFPNMQSCATVQYVMEIDRLEKARRGVYEDRVVVLSDEDTLYDSLYNTYQHEGLPPGAVCNPGLDAIEAALYPDMSADVKKENYGLTTAYYFNSDLLGKLYYAQLYPQHLMNKDKAAKVNEEVLAGNR